MSDSEAPVDSLAAQRRTTVGRDLLGPIIEWYLYRLDQHLQVAAERDALILFAARAGVRIKEAYDLYLAQRNRPPLESASVLWASRLLFCKGFLRAAPEYVNRLMRLNFYDGVGLDMVEGLCRHEPELIAGLDPTDHVLSMPIDDIQLPFDPDEVTTPAGRLLIDYFESYETLLADYLRQLGLRPDRPVVMVDSGWQGSMHRLAVEGLPKHDVKSLYFGAFPVEGNEGGIPPGVFGMVLESDRYDPTRPETAIVFYRHIIESLFEAATESPETLVRDPDGTVRCPQAVDDTPDPGRGADDFYLGVLDYLRSSRTVHPSRLLRNFVTACERLRPMIMWPDGPGGVELLSVGHRSGDFGRDLGLAVPLPVEDRHDDDSPGLRISSSLWPQAQAVVELPPRDAALVCDEFAGATTAGSYFDPRAEGDVAAHKSVLIVTRTKNRSVLLRRAAASVASQTYDNYEWVVVNDGGDEAEVKRVLHESPVDPARTTLVSNSSSVGMEAASNIGVRAAESDYVVIHDDDDSWYPTFLEATLGFLASPRGDGYSGAITGSMYVEEVIRGDEVEEVGERPYNEWVKAVDLAEMVAGNMYPPIAFVYERAVFDEVGGYDERLPVLGDWDFNLRFLLEADIGVVDQTLARYHHRKPGSSVTYSNSVIGGQSKHIEYRSKLLNRYLRGALGSEVATQVMLGSILDRMRGEVRHSRNQLRFDLRTIRPAASAVDPETPAGVARFDFARIGEERWAALNWLLQSEDSPLPPDARAGSSEEAARVIAEWIMAALDDVSSLHRIPIPREFDELSYLRINTDVAGAVRSGDFSSGFEHFFRFGGPDEGRPRPV